MRHPITHMAAGLFVSLLSALPGQAADVQNALPLDLVIPGGPTRYLDLARTFVPDLAGGENRFLGSKLVDIRHLGGPDFAGSDVETLGLYDVPHVMTKSGGKERLLALFDFAQVAPVTHGVAILALYDVAGRRPELLDAADIGFDASTYFFDQALLPVSDSTNVVLTLSSHFNSSQTYATQSMIMVRDDRFELIDSVTLLGERTCGIDRRQTIAYAADPGRANPLAPIKVTVDETISAIEEECAELGSAKLGTRQIRVTYSWSRERNRYLPDSDALERLQKENESRF